MARRESVILLHGLARSKASLRPMAEMLQQQGYHVVNDGYPSTRYPVARLAETAVSAALAQCPTGNKIHFVTHSMGGILVRQYLKQHSIAKLGRVVMLAPPNQGSELVDKLGDWPIFRWFNGPAGMELGTDEAGVPNTLGAAEFELGIIAGSCTINWWLSTMLPGPNDGKVTVENTKLAGMKDHLVLPVNHPLMMRNKEVLQQTLYFLQYGQFRH